MINKALLVGRLTKDIELRKTNSGVSVVRFTLACNRYHKSEDQKADFIPCEAWRHSADFLSKYCKKGDIIALYGSIRTDSFQGRDGKTVYDTKVSAENVQKISSKRSESQDEQVEQESVDDTYEASEGGDFNFNDEEYLPFY